MCLATVYKESDNTVICRNVSRIDVEGETVVIRDILGEETRCLLYTSPGSAQIFKGATGTECTR